MAEERSPRYDEPPAAGGAGQAYAFAQPELISRFPLGEVRADYQDSLGYLFVKRVLDVVLSSVALVVLFPLMLLVAAIIYIDDPKGSPIFIQDRIGKNGRVFRFLKFRSMVMDAEAHLNELLDKNEITRRCAAIEHMNTANENGQWGRREWTPQGG